MFFNINPDYFSVGKAEIKTIFSNLFACKCLGFGLFFGDDRVRPCSYSDYLITTPYSIVFYDRKSNTIFIPFVGF